MLKVYVTTSTKTKTLIETELVETLLTYRRTHAHLWKHITVFIHLQHKKMSCKHRHIKYIKQTHTHTQTFHSLTPWGATVRKVRLHFGWTTKEVRQKGWDTEKPTKEEVNGKGGGEGLSIKGLVQQKYYLVPSHLAWIRALVKLKAHPLRTQYFQWIRTATNGYFHY